MIEISMLIFSNSLDVSTIHDLNARETASFPERQSSGLWHSNAGPNFPNAPRRGAEKHCSYFNANLWKCPRPASGLHSFISPWCRARVLVAPASGGVAGVGAAQMDGKCWKEPRESRLRVSGLLCEPEWPEICGRSIEPEVELACCGQEQQSRVRAGRAGPEPVELACCGMSFKVNEQQRFPPALTDASSTY